MKNKPITSLSSIGYPFAFAFLMLFVNSGISQNRIEELRHVAPTTNEVIYVHANASTFVPGETLFYKIYCLEPQTMAASKLSKIAYAELISSDNMKVLTQKIYLNDGLGQGDLFIPTSLATGVYKFVCYTNWMLNKSTDKYFEIDVFVINPFEPNSKMTTEISAIATPVPAKNTFGANDTFKSDKTLYGKRERVTIKAGLERGNYSVSVRKREILPMIAAPTANDFAAQKFDPLIINLTSKNIKLPELRGELISGKITSKSGKSVSAKKIGITAQTDSFGFKIGSTDADGNFNISLDKQYPQSTIIAQVIDDDRADFTISINPESYKPLLNFERNFTLDKSMKESIEARSIASQIENVYANKKSDSVTQISQKLFFEPLGKDYKLDDYTRFPTFKETIIEVISELYYTQNNGKYELHLRDYATSIKLSEPVLTLVDGVLIQNVAELFDYKMSDVFKITILPGGYYLGAATFGGIVNIVTKEHQYATNSTGDFIVTKSSIRPQADKIYFKQDYSATAQTRIPDYRTQLLWQPKFSGNQDLWFYTSDIAGTYEVVVTGFTSDGSAISIKSEIEVK